jgi:hypothetical protein
MIRKVKEEKIEKQYMQINILIINTLKSNATNANLT